MAACFCCATVAVQAASRRRTCTELRQPKFQLDSDYPRPFDPLEPRSPAKRRLAWPSDGRQQPQTGVREAVGRGKAAVQTLAEDQGLTRPDYYWGAA